MGMRGGEQQTLEGEAGRKGLAGLRAGDDLVEDGGGLGRPAGREERFDFGDLGDERDPRNRRLGAGRNGRGTGEKKRGEGGPVDGPLDPLAGAT